MPVGMCWGASAAPDYLASLVEAIVSLSDRGFAGRALAVARGIFVKEGLSGFGGVDVCAQATVKVAGAEVRSSSKKCPAWICADQCLAGQKAFFICLVGARCRFSWGDH